MATRSKRPCTGAFELLTKVGMARTRRTHGQSTLSGGQQQRVAIARALAPSPRVRYCCDEPTIVGARSRTMPGKSSTSSTELAVEGTTMVIATHDLRLASKITSNVVFLEAGNVVRSGASRDIFGQPKQERTKRFISTLNAGHAYDI